MSKLKRLRLSGPCCLHFRYSPEEVEQRMVSRQIDLELDKEKRMLRRQVGGTRPGGGSGGGG